MRAASKGLGAFKQVLSHGWISAQRHGALESSRRFLSASGLRQPVRLRRPEGLIRACLIAQGGQDFKRSIGAERFAMGASASRQGAQAGCMADQSVIERRRRQPVRLASLAPFGMHGLDRGFQRIASGRGQLERPA